MTANSVEKEGFGFLSVSRNDLFGLGFKMHVSTFYIMTAVGTNQMRRAIEYYAFGADVPFRHIQNFNLS